MLIKGSPSNLHTGKQTTHTHNAQIFRLPHICAEMCALRLRANKWVSERAKEYFERMFCVLILSCVFWLLPFRQYLTCSLNEHSAFHSFPGDNFFAQANLPIFVRLVVVVVFALQLLFRLRFVKRFVGDWFTFGLFRMHETRTQCERKDDDTVDGEKEEKRTRNLRIRDSLRAF